MYQTLKILIQITYMASLYYMKNKKEINQNRKNYKRQSWEERTDNPKGVTSSCFSAHHKRCKGNRGLCKCKCHKDEYQTFEEIVATLSLEDKKILLESYQNKYKILSATKTTYKWKS